MSARARTRLVNSALSRHPVAQETVRNYKNLIEFKNSIADVLSKEELEDEAAMLNDCEVVQLDEVGFELDKFFVLITCFSWI